MADSRAAFEEALEVVRRAWSEERFTFDGRFTKVRDLRVIPKPMQRPTPPVYVACTFTPQSFEWTGRQGHELLFVPYASPDLDVVRRNVDLFRQARAARADGADPDVVAVLHCYCGESAEKAKEEPRGALMRYIGSFSESTRGDAYSQDYAGYQGLSDALRQFDYDGFLYPDRVIFGDPDQCVERIRALERMGTTHLGMVIDFGGLPREKIFASLERFRKHVFPKLA
jgi:alkanesulfonate monooxygenase SsuD/methylene tetrahydromethanopterin reductase-like flavin-dependent oxidoreductase (luciferase family)